MRTIVVTGVSGSLGRRVAALLVARADGTRVVGIDARPAPPVPGMGPVEHLDLAAPAAEGERVRAELDRLLANADTVVHLAWQTGDRRADALTATAAPKAGRAAGEANRVALRRVLAAAATPAMRSIVHLSSATVYGAWADNRVPLTEDVALRPNPEFAFAVGKAEAERVVSDWAAAHPAVAVCVLRPAVTVGSPERPLYHALGATRVPAAGDGARPVQYLHVDDLAAAVVVAVDRSLRGVYNVAPDSGIRESVARSLVGGVATVALPARLTRPIVAWGWNMARRGVPREALAYTVHPWVVAPDRMKSAGWEPHFTSEEALVATDGRTHFDDLPPGRRQNLTLLLAALAVSVGAGGVVAGVFAVRSRRRRR